MCEWIDLVVDALEILTKKGQPHPSEFESIGTFGRKLTEIYLYRTFCIEAHDKQLEWTTLVFPFNHYIR